MAANGAASGAVTRSTLRQQIADALRDEILAGRLRPGDAFTVKQIAEQYGVSATPVREALVDLSAQGLLDSDHHRGFCVHRFTVDDYRGMVDARMMIVDGIFRRHLATLAAPRPPAAAAPEAAGEAPDVRLGAAIASVRRRAEAASRAARAGDLDVLIGYDIRFWRELSRLVAANDYVAGFLHRLRVHAWVFAVPYLRSDHELLDWLWGGHTDLVDAITRGDAAAAIAVVEAYNAHALQWADRLERRPGH
ncbi:MULTISPECIES: GntR family transcriptional regulator [Streptomyces]|uniref:GntR family transcriptional regulator n=1 Tax=Streptomyces solicathayae TaxID=3081768 RepID=A0ABZ0LUL1_9ACTN|nr:GntR family transcriptional regulator [Streptomyces sp. HUAS YS2]WOX23040.1 GntR family transcriptional regulator [Streptomyces sp. HUAS YS2]